VAKRACVFGAGVHVWQARGFVFTGQSKFPGRELIEVGSRCHLLGGPQSTRAAAGTLARWFAGILVAEAGVKYSSSDSYSLLVDRKYGHKVDSGQKLFQFAF
jgi:hypothetical protein